jgi:hypothetical protein
MPRRDSRPQSGYLAGLIDLVYRAAAALFVRTHACNSEMLVTPENVVAIPDTREQKDLQISADSR